MSLKHGAHQSDSSTDFALVRIDLSAIFTRLEFDATSAVMFYNSATRRLAVGAILDRHDGEVDSIHFRRLVRNWALTQ